MPALPHIAPIVSTSTTFYATREYHEQLLSDINATAAGDRVLLVTMSYDPSEPTIQELAVTLEACAMRGVSITLQIDAHNFLEGEKWHVGPLFWHKHLPAQMPHNFKHITDSLTRLESAGVNVIVTNMPHRPLSVPMAGRSHIKTSIINDKIYLGGRNLNNLELDIMAAWEDSATADWLFELLGKRVTKPKTQEALGIHDIHHQMSPNAEIIIDVGVKRQSAIYKEALAAIDRAEEWIIITCQYFPNSTTAKHLKKAADRGVHVIPIFNHYKAHSPINRPLQHAVTARERLRMPVSFFDHELAPDATYLHAKLIATEQEALIGSHNYVTAGVNFGTAEIALHNKTAAFSQAAAQLIVEEVGLAQSPGLSFLFN